MSEETNIPCLLVVDDEDELRLSLRKIFQKEGFIVIEAANGEEALAAIENQHPDVVLTDMSMPQMGGMELIRIIHENAPDIEIIMLTAYGTVGSAVEAMKNGAYDFIEKPPQRGPIIQKVRQALEHQKLLRENRQLKAQIADNNDDQQMIVCSTAMEKVVATLKQAAITDVTVLLTGESGTGKDVMAQMVHRHSACNRGPFVAVNCAALPENILESELFGHEKGSFTGAHERHIGHFERADGGTLFLDEVGEMSPALQVRLLRVLQNGSFERVGGQKTIHVRTRIIAATNADLKKEVAAGRFREDLFYRLNVVAVEIPPLRERLEDIAPLAQHFVEKYASRHQREVHGLTPWALNALEQYSWPGNVRELENTIERAIVLSQNTELTVDNLPANIRPEENSLKASSIAISGSDIHLSWGMTMEQIQDILIAAALKRTDNNKKEAARLLGLNPRTIFRWLAARELPVEPDRD